MKTLQYNNYIGSGWIEWEAYKEIYASRWGSADFIKEYPETRSHMFRWIDENGNIHQSISDNAVFCTAYNTLVGIL